MDMKEISETTRKRLLKKWKGIKTRYQRYEKDGWFRKYTRGLTNVRVDLSENIDFYKKGIEKANKIIETLGK